MSSWTLYTKILRVMLKSTRKSMLVLMPETWQLVMSYNNWSCSKWSLLTALNNMQWSSRVWSNSMLFSKLFLNSLIVMKLYQVKSIWKLRQVLTHSLLVAWTLQGPSLCKKINKTLGIRARWVLVLRYMWHSHHKDSPQETAYSALTKNRRRKGNCCQDWKWWLRGMQ